jgi:hypothetical protein
VARTLPGTRDDDLLDHDLLLKSPTVSHEYHYRVSRIATAGYFFSLHLVSPISSAYCASRPRVD